MPDQTVSDPYADIDPFGRAVVAYDLPASEVDVLPGTLSCFRDAVTGFDVLLAGDDPASRVFEPEHMFE